MPCYRGCVCMSSIRSCITKLIVSVETSLAYQTRVQEAGERGLIGMLASEPSFHPEESPENCCFGNRPSSISESLECLLARDSQWHLLAEYSIKF